MAIQEYVFGELQRDVDEDLKPTVTKLMHNEPHFERGKRYRLMNGIVIEIDGILHQPAPKDRQPPGPAWDFYYWVQGWTGEPASERELLDMVESTRPVGGPRGPDG